LDTKAPTPGDAIATPNSIVGNTGVKTTYPHALCNPFHYSRTAKAVAR